MVGLCSPGSLVLPYRLHSEIAHLDCYEPTGASCHAASNNRISRRQRLKRVVGAAAPASFALLAIREGPVAFAQLADRRGDHRLRAAQRTTGHRQGRTGAPPPNARIIAVADLNLKRAERLGQELQVPGLSGLPFAVLDRKDVEVVVYATPEHWHYLPCIHACQAGKDMYGEQPLSHTIREGRRMVEAVRKYGRVFQVGEMHARTPPRARPWS